MNTSAFAQHSHCCLEQRGKRRAVTLIELMVVVLIIGLLATIATPVYTLKMEQARIATAQGECKELAMAEEACATAHGFYVPLQVLNDSITSNTTVGTTMNDQFQWLGFELAVNRGGAVDLYLISPTRDIADLYTNRATQTKLSQWNVDDIPSGYTYDPMIDKLYRQWSGPFINFHRYAYKDELKNDTAYTATQYGMYDFPLDPWGNPYRLYSPIGLLGTDARYLTWNTINSNWRTFSDGYITRDDPRFDRFAVVSYGPDGTTGLAGTTTLSTTANYTFPLRDGYVDDIYYLFGGTFNANSYKTFLY